MQKKEEFQKVYLFCIYSFRDGYFLSSHTANPMANAAATESAIGAEYITPSIPKNIGRMTISGRRKIIWRVREMKIPRLAFPMAVKKFDVIG